MTYQTQQISIATKVSIDQATRYRAAGGLSEWVREVLNAHLARHASIIHPCDDPHVRCAGGAVVYPPRIEAGD